MKQDTIWSLPYIVLIVVNFFQSMAAFMTNTTLPLYSTSLGATATIVGVVTSSFALSALLIRPFAGPAFDSFPRRKMLIMSQLIIALALFLYGIADSIPMLIAIRLLHGIGIGCSGPLAMSLVSEFLPQNRFASGISIYTLAQSFAQVIGPAVGLGLVETIGFDITYFLASLSVLVAVIGVFFIREPEHELLPYKLKLSRMFAPEALSKAVALMFIAISFSCMGAYVVLYGYEQGIENMGIFFVVYALCLIITRPLFGKLADKFGTPKLIIVGVIFFAASYITLSIADTLPLFLTAAVLGSFGFGCCAPLLQSLALASVPITRRGAASNTTFTGMDLGMLFGPVLGGQIIDVSYGAFGNMSMAYSQVWLFMLIPACGTFIIALIWILRKKKDHSSGSV